MPRSDPEQPPVIWWLRQDLRLADNPALSAAVKTGAAVVALFVLDDETPGPWRWGGASRWWLHHSLAALSADLEARGGKLILRHGVAAKIVSSLIKDMGAREIYWNRQYEPFAVARDKALKASLEENGIAVKSFNGALLAEPWEVTNGSGEPFRVFTPFWKSLSSRLTVAKPTPTPKHVQSPKTLPRSDDLKSWKLLPTAPNWATGFSDWIPGEAGAKSRLRTFMDDALPSYAADRDRPDIDGTSKLSPHLHWGEISPRAVWHAIATHVESKGSHALEAQAAKFFSELGWREFSTHLLFNFPHLPEGNFREAFNAFPWRADKKGLGAWTRGETGYPIVDAGMRELWTTGWMHNRVRMIVASFLIKDLLLDWREGERWFWNTLVDADLANNAASWQWVAGSGADAAPYFRIFNPVTQGEKFDPDGAYIRRWIPELAKIDPRLVHRPWEAGQPPKDYPPPIVDHAAARDRALAAFAKIKG
jgi:deoxyribodipyrimidine photo-lyase